MQVAYEHIRLAPNGELTQQGILEDLSADDTPSSAHQEGTQREKELHTPDDPAQIMMEAFGQKDADLSEYEMSTLQSSLFSKIVAGNPEMDVGTSIRKPATCKGFRATIRRAESIRRDILSDW